MFEVVLRRKAFDDAFEVSLQVGGWLAGDDGILGAEAVPECAAAGCRLAALGVRSSPDHWYQVRDGGEERARAECHSRCGQLLDRLDSFGSFGVGITQKF